MTSSFGARVLGNLTRRGNLPDGTMLVILSEQNALVNVLPKSPQHSNLCRKGVCVCRNIAAGAARLRRIELAPPRLALALRPMVTAVHLWLRAHVQWSVVWMM